jgi:putative chitinase
MINRKVFFEKVRISLFDGKITAAQVDGIERVLDEWERRKLTDLRWLACMLATDYHETAQTMQPIREMGGEKYLKSKKYYPWVGEGLVQVTWEVNHRKFGATAPGQLMTWPLCLKPLFDGMIDGVFTGKKLADYFSATNDDDIGARKIINGTDKAGLIAGYHRNFLSALKASEIVPTAPIPIPSTPLPNSTPMSPSDKPMGLLAAFIALILSIFKKRN